MRMILIRAFSSFNRVVTGSAMNVSGMRKPYKGVTEIFDLGNLVSKEPLGQFKDWFQTACETDGIMEANAMSLATATKDGIPSVRVVLLKEFDKDGFKFFTNYESRKGRELAQNPRASLQFFWEPLMRVVRVEGMVEKLSKEASTEYFQSRPKASQIGAAVSNQSRVIASREVLSERDAQLHEQYKDVEVLPKPACWGGYVLKPHMVEFWQGQTNRLHDRIVFRRPASDEQIDPKVTHQGDEGWVFERLSP